MQPLTPLKKIQSMIQCVCVCVNIPASLGPLGPGWIPALLCSPAGDSAAPPVVVLCRWPTWSSGWRSSSRSLYNALEWRSSRRRSLFSRPPRSPLPPVSPSPPGGLSVDGRSRQTSVLILALCFVTARLTLPKLLLLLPGCVSIS